MTVCPALKGVRIPTPAGWGGVMSLMVSIARPEKQEAALMPGLPTRGVKTSERKNLKKENEIPQGQVSQSVPAPAASARKPIAKGAKGARGGSRGQEEGVLGPSRGTLLFKY